MSKVRDLPPVSGSIIWARQASSSEANDISNHTVSVLVKTLLPKSKFQQHVLYLTFQEVNALNKILKVKVLTFRNNCIEVKMPEGHIQEMLL